MQKNIYSKTFVIDKCQTNKPTLIPIMVFEANFKKKLIENWILKLINLLAKKYSKLSEVLTVLKITQF